MYIDFEKFSSAIDSLDVSDKRKIFFLCNLIDSPASFALKRAMEAGEMYLKDDRLKSIVEKVQNFTRDSLSQAVKEVSAICAETKKENAAAYYAAYAVYYAVITSQCAFFGESSQVTECIMGVLYNCARAEQSDISWGEQHMINILLKYLAEKEQGEECNT